MQDDEFYNPKKFFIGTFIPSFIMRDGELTPSSKLLFAKLCDYAGDDGEVYPSQATLSRDLGCDTKTVYRSIEILEKRGLIRVVASTHDERLSGMNNCYKFPISSILDHTNSIKRGALTGTKCPMVEQGLKLGENVESDQNTAQISHQAKCPVVPSGKMPDAYIGVSKSDKDVSRNSQTDLQELKQHPRWLAYATRLASAIKEVKKIPVTKTHLRSWAHHFCMLHIKDQVPVPDIKKALDWYCAELPIRHGEKYFLVIHSGISFREKYHEKLVPAMARTFGGQQNFNNEEQETTNTFVPKLVGKTFRQTMDQVWKDHGTTVANLNRLAAEHGWAENDKRRLYLAEYESTLVDLTKVDGE